MKKRISLIALALIVLSLILVNKFYAGFNSVEEAIKASGTEPLSIIHEEKNDKGSIVFCYTSGGNGLYTAVLRRDINGYKTVYSGVQGDIKLAASNFGLSHTYFPGIEKTELPVYFGVIGNPDISQVQLVEKKRNIESQAKIINAEGIRLWLAYMNELQGSDFDIVGLSAEGKEVVKIDGNISSYYTEQKPFKGYK